MELTKLFESINNIDVILNYKELIKVKNIDEKKIERISVKNYTLEDKVELKVKNIAKAITKCEENSMNSINNIDENNIDEEEKLKENQLKNEKELVRIKIYEQQLQQYKKFLDDYLKDASNVFVPNYGYNIQEKKREFSRGEEVTSYIRVKETVRKIKMNLLLGGWHNAVSWQEVQDYKFWKYVSKFNKIMADVIEHSVGCGG